MKNHWTPILAVPLLLLVSLPFGGPVYQFCSLAGYPLWLKTLAGGVALAYAWSASHNRFKYLTAQRRTGGPPSMADLSKLVLRQGFLLTIQLAAILGGYALAPDTSVRTRSSRSASSPGRVKVPTPWSWNSGGGSPGWWRAAR